jgi:hypothetical protein
MRPPSSSRSIFIFGCANSFLASGKNRKNALFAGHDQGAENWACIASLIETCKLDGVDPQAYLTDVLSKHLHRRRALWCLVRRRPRAPDQK